MKNTVYTVIVICLCLLIGKIINHAVGGLPASLYGMIFYCVLLQIGLFNPSKVQNANQWIIKNMGVCFIPAAVGVINHFELIKVHGYTIVSVILFTTFLLITIVGYLSERYLVNKKTYPTAAKDN